MKKIAIAAMAAVGLVCGGCGPLVIQTPVPIGQKQDYRQEYTYGGKDAFYYNSRLLIVNASQYKVRLVKNGTELPTFYLPMQEVDIKIPNRPYSEEVANMVAVAYDRYNNRVVGTVERTFTFTGNGKQVVEQWVLKDWMFK